MATAPTSTTEHLGDPVIAPPGYWQREASHYPKPLTPAFRCYPEWATAIWRQVTVENGMMYDGVDFVEIGGLVYQRIVPMGGKDRTPPPPWLMKIIVRLPPVRTRVQACINAARADVIGQVMDDWDRSWRDQQAEAIARRRAVDLASLSDTALDTHLNDVVTFGRDSLLMHYRLTATAQTIAELAFFLEGVLQWDEQRALTLVNGLSAFSTTPAEKLAELADMGRKRPALRDQLRTPDPSTLDRIHTIDPEFAAAFDAYQDKFGCRALRYEVCDPSLEEVPELLLGLINDQLTRSYDPKAEADRLSAEREQAVVAARQELLQHSEAERAEFERLLERVKQCYPVREENEFYTVSAPIALMRYAMLEAGRRLARDGAIPARADVFFLTADEQRATLASHTDQRALIATRQAEYERLLTQPPVMTYGKEPAPPPPWSVFPAEAAANVRAVLWVADRIFGADVKDQPATVRELKGVGAAAGIYEGPVRVIRGESEFDKIQAGDVLVCPITSPVWSILFPSVGALVTNSGGILSHPAIIAREYGVPAVVSTGNGTEILRDGQIVTVDGQAGTVTIS